MTYRIIAFAVAAMLLIWGGLRVNQWLDSRRAEQTQQEQTTMQQQEDSLRSKLGIQDTVVGTGDEAVSGSFVTVHYRGRLENGTPFDNSYDRGAPFEVQLGVGQVIKGWDLGLVGMKVGGKRTLTIPPDLGYGASGAGNGIIPPNATLVFDVELLGVRK